MMVRYAGPKVFVALQETEGIHDEGGTEGTPVKQRFWFWEVFLPWFFWQKKSESMEREMIWQQRSGMKLGQVCLSIMEFGYKVQHGKLWTSRFVLEIGYFILFYIYLHTHIYWIFSRGSLKTLHLSRATVTGRDFASQGSQKKGNFQALMLVDCRLESGFDGKNSSVITDINWHCSIILRVHVSSLGVLDATCDWTPFCP